MSVSDNNGANGAADINVTATEGKAGEFFKERLLHDSEKVDQKDIDQLEESVPKKLKGFNLSDLGEGMSWVTTLLDRVRGAYDMIRDKEYTITGKTKALIAAALIYFVLPTDLTPDFIPGIGYIDDAVVLSMLWKLIGDEVEKYLQTHRRYFPE